MAQDLVGHEYLDRHGDPSENHRASSQYLTLTRFASRHEHADEKLHEFPLLEHPRLNPSLTLHGV